MQGNKTTVFTISQEQKQYSTYLLTDTTANTQIEVVPERGGIITHWRKAEQEILYLDEARYADPTKTIRGGVPILFPICGNLPDDTYSYQGNEYKLPQHGFARNLPWDVIATSTDDCASITLSLKSDESTLAVYPFACEIVFTYQLRGNSLTILQAYTNNSDSDMPFSAGFHPYFTVGEKQQLELDIPETKYFSNVTKTMMDFSGSFDFDLDEIDAAFVPMRKNSSSFSDRDRKITLEYPDFFSTIVFWTVKGKDFICLEPWSAPRNAINTGEKLIYIKPGTTYNSTLTMNCETI
ncbi:galactose mutarotase-like enzyme [Xenococcus sp. PCC 7305]|uniref:aldose epimerase family protein n=1 Tax=Xenococcus sp. PCC 7305 TaxID=102125 RepID=UPI0002AC2DDC|nr:galactose mutarotase-like enzyme [Xenococcus sp. PCC 7305]ELS05140.1 galactose mutarotase-like enzyme [Xenococcus sp. PCC 7305]